MLLGSLLRRAHHQLFQLSRALRRGLDIQTVITNQTEQDPVAVDAVVSHHFLHGNITGA